MIPVILTKTPKNSCQPSGNHLVSKKKAKIRPNIIQESDSDSETATKVNAKKGVVRVRSGQFRRKYKIPADCKLHGDSEIEKLLTRWELTVDKYATSLIGKASLSKICE
jgi:hypothetical protein